MELLVPRRNRFKASLNIFNPQELVTLLMVVREKNLNSIKMILTVTLLYCGF